MNVYIYITSQTYFKYIVKLGAPTPIAVRVFANPVDALAYADALKAEGHEIATAPSYMQLVGAALKYEHEQKVAKAQEMEPQEMAQSVEELESETQIRRARKKRGS